jgi:hypothetical protein
VTLEASPDGGQTWQELGHWSGWSGKRWSKQSVDLAALSGDALSGDVQLRWRYASDALYQGRGVYVDAIRVTSKRRTVFDDSRRRDAQRVRTDGWTAAEG